MYRSFSGDFGRLSTNALNSASVVPRLVMITKDSGLPVAVHVDDEDVEDAVMETEMEMVGVGVGSGRSGPSGNGSRPSM